MKPRIRKIIAVSGIALATYFGAYFSCVRIGHWEHKGQFISVPFYRPLNTGMVRAVFTPAQSVDETYFRPSRWHVANTRLTEVL